MNPTDYEIEYCVFHAVENPNNPIDEIRQTTLSLVSEGDMSVTEGQRIFELLKEDNFLAFLNNEIKRYTL